MTNKTGKFGAFTEKENKQFADDVASTGRILSAYNRRYQTPKNTDMKWRILGEVERVQAGKRGVILECEQGAVGIHAVAVNCLRIRAARNASQLQHAPFSYSVEKTSWPEVPLQIETGQNEIILRTASLLCRIHRYPFRISLETLNHQSICEDTLGIQLREDEAVRLSMRLQPDETSYGLGERASGLNLRGRTYQLWNTHQPAYPIGADPLSCTVPFYLGIHTHGAYGLFWDNPSRGTVDIGKSSANEMIFEAEAGEMCYYLFTGNDVKAVLSRYTELIGRMPQPPQWFLGGHHGRASLTTQEEVLALAQDFRERGIPCDTLHLSSSVTEGFRPFTWDKTRFPDFPGMIRQLHRRGFKVIMEVSPGIKIDPVYTAYMDGLKQDVFLKYPDGEPLAGATLAGMSHFPDFTKAAARSWWSEQCQPLIEAGVDGFLNTLNEPVIFTPDGSASLPDYVQHEGDGHPGSHMRYHNVYGQLTGAASFQTLEAGRPERRPVNLLRAGFAGSQRTSAIAMGENSSEWEHLRLSISMALNMGLSGLPMAGADIGGFYGRGSGELLTRWLQAACLMPYFGNHAAFDAGEQEPWAFGQPYEVINRITIEMRYRLLPYLYSVVAQCREYGWPIIRPIFMAEPHNPDIRAIDDCYLLGDAVLVAPVIRPGAVSRRVYLPAGEWYDYWTNEPLEGGEFHEVPAPLERLPLFIRAGAVLPLAAERQYIAEDKANSLHMRVYPGEFETVLYEDAGEGLAYKQGEYRWVYLSSAWDDDTLIIKRRTAGRYQPAYKAIKLEIVHLSDEPAEVRVDRKGAPVWFYDDGVLELNMGTFQQVEIVRKASNTDRTLMSRPRL